MSRLQIGIVMALLACGPTPEPGLVGAPAVDRSAWRGVLQWHDGASTSAEGLDLAADGSLLVAGYGRDTDRFRSFAVRIGHDGHRTWTAHHDPVLDSMARAVAARPDGSAVLATQAKLVPTANEQWLHLAQIDGQGELRTGLDTLDLWAVEPGDHTVPGDLDAGSDGSVAVVGHGAGPDTQAALLVRYDPAGSVVFDRELVRTRGQVRGAGVAVWGSATAYAVNSSGEAFGDAPLGGYDAWVGVVDARGVEVWSDQIGAGLDQFVGGVAFDDRGNLYVCGSAHASLVTGRPHPGGRDVFLRKYAPTGAVLWTVEDGSPATDGCADVHVAPDGAVLTAGHWAYDPDGTGHGAGFVASWEPDGSPRWFRTLDPVAPARTFAHGVVADGSDVLVCGSTTGTFAGQVGSGDQDAWVARLGVDGSLR